MTRDENNSDKQPDRVPAAQYIRMSTEHQQYSTENQAKAITEYARQRGYDVVKTYADGGKSGLTIAGRDSLRQLIQDVQQGDAHFKTILVYDISRWGRFIDADESAYYEFICRRAGIDVQYCAEHFDNDGSTQATIFKSVKRAMAGEYSRELSVKVFQGQCTLIEKGYRQGGTAGYGLRRMLVDMSGQPKSILKQGEHKSIQTDRVILVPGPEAEINTVQRIYRVFIQEGKNEREIAELLNRERIPSEWPRPWTRSMVHQILTNEKYIGNNVFNRRSFKLKTKRVKNPVDMWVRLDDAFDPIVDAESFFMVRGIIQERCRRYSDEEMLALLKSLSSKHSRISGFLIDETEGMPSSSSYRTRFGSLIRAYRLIGYTPDRDYEFVQINRQLRRMHPEFVDETVKKLEEMGGTVERDPQTDLLLINDEYTTSVVLSRCRQTTAGTLNWLVRLDQHLAPDITIVARMDATNKSIADYYLIPRIDVGPDRVRMGEDNGVYLDTYRFGNLDYFWELASRSRAEVAA